MDIRNELKKAAVCVHIAVEEVVAKDLSRIMHSGCDEICRLDTEVERLTAENMRHKTALKEIMDNQNDFCTTCDENVDTAAEALNWSVAEAVQP
jgi:hypothetical protein